MFVSCGCRNKGALTADAHPLPVLETGSLRSGSLGQAKVESGTCLMALWEEVHFLSPPPFWGYLMKTSSSLVVARFLDLLHLCPSVSACMCTHVHMCMQMCTHRCVLVCCASVFV